METKQIEIRRQTELGSQRWGIYVNGVLVEGGFFNRAAALAASSQYQGGK